MASEPSAKGSRNLRIGKYQVVKHIATGGMGAVYRAKDVELGREVALKVLPPEAARKKTLLERFRREALHGAKLRHENIVALFDCGESNGFYFLALEYIDGVDLFRYITRRGQLDVKEAQDLIVQATKALAHLHQHGIVHRDIKPSNFLVAQKDGRPLLKLIDLGLSREVNDEEFRVTRAGTTLGTVDYMAPEQARDSGTADIRSDIYSLGCTWYHMLAGKAPFPEGSLTERLYKHVEVAPPDIRQFNSKVPDTAVETLSRMLAKKPEDRYQAPLDLLKDLEHPRRTSKEISADVLADLASGEEEKPARPAVPKRPGRARAQERSRNGTDGEAEGPEESLAVSDLKQDWLVWGAAGLAVVVMIAALVVLMWK
jgi:serine/threonine-protein kinase